jgi:hypothetical protein
MRGPIIIPVIEHHVSTLKCYQNIETGHDQSGNPVWTCSASEQLKLVGIDLGYDPSLNCNVTLLLTPKIFRWIIRQAAEILRRDSSTRGDAQ